MSLRSHGPRRSSSLTLLVAAAATAVLAASCAPNEQAQTVSFVLDLDSDKVSRIEFDVTYSSGGFASTDGQCVVGSAAGPRSLAAGTDRAVVRPAVKHVAVKRSVRAASKPAAIGGSGLDTTTSSTVTTTSMPTTTTTLAEFNCELTMRVQGTTQPIGSLQWITSYADAPGEMAGTADGVECLSEVSGVLAAFNDDEATRSVSGGLVSLSGFNAPADVARCIFTATAVPQVSDFTITLEEATGPDLIPLSPSPAVLVSDISCDAGPTTTTTTMQGPTTTLDTTTTTLPGGGQCGNGVVNAGEQCDDQNTANGDGCSSTCQVEYAFTAVDNDAGRLTIRVVNGRGIPPGAALALCKFQGELDEDTLEVEVVECGLPDGDPCDPDDDVEVTVSSTTTTTTTTTSTTKSTTTTTTTTTLASSSQAAGR